MPSTPPPKSDDDAPNHDPTPRRDAWLAATRGFGALLAESTPRMAHDHDEADRLDGDLETLTAALELLEEEIADELGVRPDELHAEHFRILLQAANHAYLVRHGVIAPSAHPTDPSPHPGAARLSRAWADTMLRLARRHGRHERDRSSRRERSSSRLRRAPGETDDT